MNNFFHAFFATTERTVVTVVVVVVGFIFFVAQSDNLKVSLNENFASGSQISVSSVCSGASPVTTLTWQPTSKQAGAGYRLNISKTQNFNKRSVKYIGRGILSTTAPDGFDSSLTLDPGTTYYARVIFSATQETSVPTSFVVPVCGDATDDDGDSTDTGDVNTTNGTSSVDLMVNDANVVVWTNDVKDRVHLRWTSSNTTSCSYKVNQGAAKTVATVGSADVIPGAGNSTITLACAGPAGTVSDAVRVEQHKRNIGSQKASTSPTQVGTTGYAIGETTKMPSGVITVDPIDTYIAAVTGPGEEYFVSNAYVEGWSLDPRKPRIAAPPFNSAVAFYVTEGPNQLPMYEGRYICFDKANFYTSINLPHTVPGFEGDHHGFKAKIPAKFLDGRKHYLSACIMTGLGNDLSDVQNYWLDDTTFFMKDVPFTLSAPTDLKVSTTLQPSTGPVKEAYMKHGQYGDGPLSVSFDPTIGQSATVHFKWTAGGATQCLITSPDTGSIKTGIRQGMTGAEGISYENIVSGYGDHHYLLTCKDAFGATTTDTVTVIGPEDPIDVVDLKVSDIRVDNTRTPHDGPLTVNAANTDIYLYWRTSQATVSCTSDFGFNSAPLTAKDPTKVGMYLGGNAKLTSPAKGQSKTATITCVDEDGATKSDSITVNAQ